MRIIWQLDLEVDTYSFPKNLEYDTQIGPQWFDEDWSSLRRALHGHLDWIDPDENSEYLPVVTGEKREELNTRIDSVYDE